ncbi:hypothetical protein AB0O33_27175, partial [Streptomyces sp. NPDC089795]
MECTPAAGAPPRAVDRAAYRVVQEALTNIAEHAPDAPATVLVRHTSDDADDADDTDAADTGGRTEVAVTNGPVRPAPAAPTRTAPGALGENRRLGLIGLHERVRPAGGTFTAGPDGDGFAVRAELPHRPGAAGPRPAAPARPVGVLPRSTAARAAAC